MVATPVLARNPAAQPPRTGPDPTRRPVNRPGFVGHIVQRNSRDLLWPGWTVEGLECPGRAVTLNGRGGRPGRPGPAPTPRPRAGSPASTRPWPASVPSSTLAGGSGRPGPGRLVPGGGEPG